MPYNLDREFIKWFYEDEYPQFGSNRRAVFGRSAEQSIEVIDYWMREAYKAGAARAANETLCKLSEWSAGILEVDPYNAFECAGENLDFFYKDYIK